MSKLTRTLIIGATLAAMHLAGMTAVAQAQANDEPVMATAHRTPSRGVLAPPPGRLAGADRRGCRPPAGAGPRALLHPQRNTRPDTGPSAARTQRTTQLARRFPRWLCCRPGAGRRAGDARRQTGRPQRPGRARGLTSVTVTPLDGAAGPARQPHRAAGAWSGGVPEPSPGLVRVAASTASPPASARPAANPPRDATSQLGCPLGSGGTGAGVGAGVGLGMAKRSRACTRWRAASAAVCSGEAAWRWRQDSPTWRSVGGCMTGSSLAWAWATAVMPARCIAARVAPMMRVRVSLDMVASRSIN